MTGPVLPQGMFFPLANENETLPNRATEPLIQGVQRMVYLSVSEYFFDSALFAYYQAGVLSMEIEGQKVCAAGVWSGVWAILTSAREPLARPRGLTLLFRCCSRCPKTWMFC